MTPRDISTGLVEAGGKAQSGSQFEPIGIVVVAFFAAVPRAAECGDYRHTKAHQLRSKRGHSPYCSLERADRPLRPSR